MRDLIVFVALIVVIVLMVIFSPANAHSWYPQDCCSGQDCAEVESAVEHPDGSVTVKTKHGTAKMPKGFKKRPSNDNKDHACIITLPPDSFDQNPAGSYLRCYFTPMGS